MNTKQIEIDLLRPHPANCNEMPANLLAKLAGHIEKSERYPPIIVRLLGDGDGYQILDGHHRVMALRKIGRAEACCVVWEVGDDEALVLLATLNQLRGGDDVFKRAG